MADNGGMCVMMCVMMGDVCDDVCDDDVCDKGSMRAGEVV